MDESSSEIAVINDAGIMLCHSNKCNVTCFTVVLHKPKLDAAEPEQIKKNLLIPPLGYQLTNPRYITGHKTLSFRSVLLRLVGCAPACALHDASAESNLLSLIS